MEKSTLRFHWLDLLRFSAALLVVIVHTRGAVFVEYGALSSDDKTIIVTLAYALTRVANEAVLVFFVLSGFLVGGRTLERILSNTFRPMDYATDRITRIMLPLVPALILTAIVQLTISGEFNFPVFLGNMISLQGILVPVFGENAPLWSLSYEVWFYILVWAAGFTLTRKRFQPLPSSIIVLVAIIFTALSPVYLFCWLIGTFAYHFRSNKFTAGQLAFSIGLCLYGMIAIQVGYNTVSVSVETLKNYLPPPDASKIIFSTGIALLLRQIINLPPNNSLTSKLDTLGTTLAASSYTLYLTHYPILKLVSYMGVKRSQNIDASSIRIFLLVIGGCLIISYGFYWIFERHTNAVRVWIKNRLVRIKALQ